MKFRLFAVQFELSFLSVAVMSMVLILDSSTKFLMCFVASLIHECGHIVAMLSCRVRPVAVRLRLFDIVIESERVRSQYADLFITLAGPVTNLLCACVFYDISTMLFVSNLVIGLFNLLPVETFDGGHALKIILSEFFTLKTCDVTLKVLTFILLLPMLTIGVIVLLNSQYNYSLLLISVYLIVILFMK